MPLALRLFANADDLIQSSLKQVLTTNEESKDDSLFVPLLQSLDHSEVKEVAEESDHEASELIEINSD